VKPALPIVVLRQDFNNLYEIGSAQNEMIALARMMAIVPSESFGKFYSTLKGIRIGLQSSERIKITDQIFTFGWSLSESVYRAVTEGIHEGAGGSFDDAAIVPGVLAGCEVRGAIFYDPADRKYSVMVGIAYLTPYNAPSAVGRLLVVGSIGLLLLALLKGSKK
jgi:hypothetical protein